MSIREQVRRVRLYCKSHQVFQERLTSPLLACWLPLAPRGRAVDVSFKSGRRVRMVPEHWPLLPSACRLDGIGAEFEFSPTEKKIVVDGLTFFTPLWRRNEAAYLKEVLLDDVYLIKGRDLRGRVVVDVGAYVGDATLAFARQGATVACRRTRGAQSRGTDGRR
jgi:hypothetical protein